MSCGSAADRSSDAAGRVAGPDGASSYPGGKSGAGIYQRLINRIPKHGTLISAFAGKCGVTRNIRPAENTIVIDADPDVCEWWDKWRRTKTGRDLEIHNCDSIEWLKFHFGLTEYSAAEESGSRGRRGSKRLVMGGSDGIRETAATPKSPAEYFVYCDPPYVLSGRSKGKLYRHELDDSQHVRLLEVLTRIKPSRAAIMLCGYPSDLYAAMDRKWKVIKHRVPTRGGLQDERIWMNYESPLRLHDYRYIGDCRRNRERIRRRQRNWLSQLNAMPAAERAAMLETLMEDRRAV